MKYPVDGFSKDNEDANQNTMECLLNRVWLRHRARHEERGNKQFSS
jgi:hypothetical protein